MIYQKNSRPLKKKLSHFLNLYEIMMVDENRYKIHCEHKYKYCSTKIAIVIK